VVCGVCGGKNIREAEYTAREDSGARLVGVPALQCATCGSILPDAKKIESMPGLKIPSSVRMRCAKIKSGE
jgi:YgiT-type zinc finger domain-containing protein